MIHFTLPEKDAIQQFLEQQKDESFTYSHQGSTATTPPEGFKVDHTRACLGRGIEVFRAAEMALRQWQQFNLGWVVAKPPTTEIEVGKSVCVIGRAAGLYWLNACRILYVVDQRGPNPKFGFAYGTLPAHMEAGEEMFMIEMDDRGDVWYEILAFSRPKRLITWLTYFYMRVLQKRFHRESAARMKQIVESHVATSPQAQADQLSHMEDMYRLRGAG